MFARALAATAIGRFAVAAEPLVGFPFAAERLTAAGALAGGACRGALSPAPITMLAPHAGQRAFVPSDHAGAVSFRPQAHRTVMAAVAGILHHPSSRQVQSTDLDRWDSNRCRRVAQPAIAEAREHPLNAAFISGLRLKIFRALPVDPDHGRPTVDLPVNATRKNRHEQSRPDATA